ncbi:SRPBCC domain-containing protein [Sutcliffiella rhizosphaerae]|uniref:Activator of Hsp90 ATPase homologue 1/2-like C-terminal domain-containing protein n=1 Tax=Sutcliffiella rhizosphaerae TaxID=2880967 RepID=A0ABN8ADY7_9BACI|nr:SRPBCC domain-containing protein [Sutcliffiella rhizosphaerae]CAG9622496.1 hypothetical protein BACCIP111883_03287 [Sutcliffiella rhizosphaerae]
MNQFGKLYQADNRYCLQFERFFPKQTEEVFQTLTDSHLFTLWYPFATGEVEWRVGGKIHFNDGDGSLYEGVISKLEAPSTFVFKEVEDLLEMYVKKEMNGCKLTFIHTFDNKEMAMYIAAGWHRCLDVFEQIVNGEEIEWKNNASSLRSYYKEIFTTTT